MSQAEVDDILKRIQNYAGVVGYIIVNSEGIPIKMTIDNAIAVHYAGLVCDLVGKGRYTVKELDKTDDLIFLRLRTNNEEIIIVPDKELMLVVIQNPVD